MRFSVIVPFLNEEKYINKCIDSLLDQSFKKKDFEVIFVNNGSMDSSAEIIKSRNVRLLNHPHGNEYSARNHAISKAKGEIFAFTDADCVVDRQWLSNLDKIFANKLIDVVLGKREFAKTSSVWLKTLEEYENAKAEYVCINKLKHYYFGYANNMAIRKSVFDKVGKFKTKPVNGDTQIIHQLIMLSPKSKVAYIHSAKIRHLEVIFFFDWLKKLFKYGVENSKYVSQETHCRALNTKLRLNIFRFQAEKNKYTLAQQMLAFLILIIGSGVYKLSAISR